MRILCIGDSLGLPREGCSYEDTWIFLLKQKYPQHSFINSFTRRQLISEALREYQNHTIHFKADVVILQQGICDCSPRYVNDLLFVNRVIKWIFDKLNRTELYWRIVKQTPRKQNCVYTKPDNFKRDYKCLIDSVLTAGGSIILIKIGHGSESVQKSSPFYNSNVDKYNHIIDEIAKGYNKVYVVDPLNRVVDEMFVDGYHCNKVGMYKVYEELSCVIDKIA